MRYEDLNEYDQELLNTDLGDFEKEAAEKLAEANEVYAYGQEQAHAIADQMDEMMSKVAEEEEEEDDEEEMDEESEKKAAELGAFIERGLFDELVKLGSERHDDPLHYYYPYMEEKVAQIGAEEKLAAWYHELGKKVKDVAGKATDKVKAGWQSAKDKGREFAEGARHEGGFLKRDVVGTLKGPERARFLGHLATKSAPGLALGAGAGAGGMYAASRKKRRK